MLELDFNFTEKCWLWTADKAAWHFVNVPKSHSEEIKFFTDSHFGKRRGWGAVRVTVRIGASEWQTSIFPSKSLDTYILPIKADVRKKENIVIDKMVEVTLKIKV
jgi:Domain of unknown function (DUF1905)